MSRRPCWLQAITLVALVLVLVLTGGSAVISFTSQLGDTTCRSDLQSNAARTRRILRLLRKSEEGRAIVQRLTQTPRVCFGTVTYGVLRSDGIFVLSAANSDWSNAARLAHLMLHRHERLPADESAMNNRANSCEELVERLMNSERRALAVENRMLVAQGLVPLKDTLAELELAYMQRCRRLRLDDTTSK